MRDIADQTMGAAVPPKNPRGLPMLRRPREIRSPTIPLTDAPLDLDNPAHLQALLRAYERFPVIGGRAPA